MTTLRIQNIACPHCNNKMYIIGVMSYTLRNSEVFSDGKVISNPPRPSEQNILICSECYKAFWKNDAQIDNEKSEELLDELPEANSIIDLFPGFEPDHKLKLANYINELLDKGFANTVEREVFLRLELWRTLNDIIRYQKDSMSPQSKNLFNNNLTSLITIYSPKSEEEQLLLVEMHREFGQFDKASELLKKTIWSEDNFAFLQIKNAVKNKNSTLIKL